ncbi:NAD(P)/FAD-dependent oxidoreductase [Sporosarcina sp. P13]|uniref:NAD(P)/FAD-dependent oxidoreductase n=1 Tax=Sporosarcina sp. P13 TaxID=2048263 RepID=UPI001304200A|nr:FAD-dependent oxidoreductase [Sporosarcina sp. P13]
MSTYNQIVIIGAGIAGVNAAKTLLDNDYEGKVVLIDRDENLPYDRPPLSKEYLAGTMDNDGILLHPEEFYRDDRMELLLGKSVTELRPDKKTVILNDGEEIGWDKLLITTGSKLRRLQPLDEQNFENVFYLKTQKDASRVQEQLSSINHLAIIGAGFIGLEVAASMLAAGKQVTVFEAAKTPLSRVLGEDMGTYIAEKHRAKGIEIFTDDYITQFKGDSSIREVETKNGIKLACDGVLVGIGVSTDGLLVEGILDFDDGIIVNEFCETSVADIYAAGDCARWTYPISGEKIRIEHWDHAMNQGATAALNMLQPNSQPFTTIPYFWSNQHDLAIQYVGHPTTWDQTVLRGSMEDDTFTMFYLLENKVVGALIVNQPTNVLPIRRLISQSVIVNTDQLGDEKVKLKQIIKQAAVIN